MFIFCAGCNCFNRLVVETDERVFLMKRHRRSVDPLVDDTCIHPVVWMWFSLCRGGPWSSTTTAGWFAHSRGGTGERSTQGLGRCRWASGGACSQVTPGRIRVYSYSATLIFLQFQRAVLGRGDCAHPKDRFKREYSRYLGPAISV